jgi:hypothetical protein
MSPLLPGCSSSVPVMPEVLSVDHNMARPEALHHVYPWDIPTTSSAMFPKVDGLSFVQPPDELFLDLWDASLIRQASSS